MKIRLFIFFALTFLFVASLPAQGLRPAYSLFSFLPDEAFIYTSGKKRVDTLDLTVRQSKNSNFYISQFGFDSKKKWEKIIDMHVDYEKTSGIFKRAGFFYTIVAAKNPRLKSRTVYTHFAIKFDSLGTILIVKKLKDSTFYGFNRVHYTDDFVYVFLNKNGIICEKYDYNFNLLEIIKDNLLISMFYDSRVFKTKKNYISIGPLTDTTLVNKHIRNGTTLLYKPIGDFIKKSSNDLIKRSQLTLTPLPINEKFDFAAFDNDRIYIVTLDHSKTTYRNYKLYAYSEEPSRLELITDTLSGPLEYLKVLANNKYLLITVGKETYVKPGVWSKKPRSLYYIKNNKVLAHLELTEFDEKNIACRFRFFNNKLYIYQIDDSNNSLKIKVFDYEKGVFLE